MAVHDRFRPSVAFREPVAAPAKIARGLLIQRVYVGVETSMHAHAVGRLVIVDELMKEEPVFLGESVEEQLVRQRTLLEIDGHPGGGDTREQRLGRGWRITPDRIERVHPQQPGMTAEVGPRVQHPFFVIAAKADDAHGRLSPEPEDSLDAAPGIWSAVDIVAEEHDRVLAADDAADLQEQIVEGLQIAVDVADRQRRHGADCPRKRRNPNARRRPIGPRAKCSGVEKRPALQDLTTTERRERERKRE